MLTLITGGTGFIGSHTVVELINAGDDVVILDNLSNSSEKVLDRIEQISGKKPTFVKGDILDSDCLEAVFSQYQFDNVIHFAGLKAVGESNEIPLHYYRNNVFGTINLCEVMAKHNVKNIVFSSSATVYGDPATVPIRENFPTCATNPYGRSKLMVEEILQDLYKSDSEWNIALLRYFNPVGAHKSGLIGESPNGIPNNLVPYISQVAVGKLQELGVFGDDYNTPDGTGVRDYIHVVDLSLGHLKALDKLKSNPGLVTYNLGTGQGYSVLEMIKAFEKASQKAIPFNIQPRRPGDIASCYAEPAYANTELDWSASRDLEEMMEDSWRWQHNNPNGYED